MKIPQLHKRYAHLQDKVTHYEESPHAPYEMNGVTYSAYQRNEVVGRWTYIDKEGVERVIAYPVRRWGKKEHEEDDELQRQNKLRLKKKYKDGEIGEKYARIHGLK